VALEYPDNLKYTDTHEYARVEGEVVTVGISAHAVDQLGDVVFAEVPEAGDTFAAGDEMASVESVKAVGTIYAPVAGEVVEANEALADSPELFNADPYGDAWVVKLRASDPSELEKLLSAEAYRALVEGEG